MNLSHVMVFFTRGGRPIISGYIYDLLTIFFQLIINDAEIHSKAHINHS